MGIRRRDMTRDLAEKVIQGLLSAIRLVNDNLFLVQVEASETMYGEYQKRSAEVIAAIYLDLIKPIVKFYPDLDPGRDGDGRKQGEG
jgi:hypothetical protein